MNSSWNSKVYTWLQDCIRLISGLYTPGCRLVIADCEFTHRARAQKIMTLPNYWQSIVSWCLSFPCFSNMSGNKPPFRCGMTSYENRCSSLKEGCPVYPLLAITVTVFLVRYTVNILAMMWHNRWERTYSEISLIRPLLKQYSFDFGEIET